MDQQTCVIARELKVAVRVALHVVLLPAKRLQLAQFQGSMRLTLLAVRSRAELSSRAEPLQDEASNAGPVIVMVQRLLVAGLTTVAINISKNAEHQALYCVFILCFVYSLL